MWCWWRLYILETWAVGKHLQKLSLRKYFVNYNRIHYVLLALIWWMATNVCNFEKDKGTNSLVHIFRAVFLQVTTVVDFPPTQTRFSCGKTISQLLMVRCGRCLVTFPSPSNWVSVWVVFASRLAVWFTKLQLVVWHGINCQSSLTTCSQKCRNNWTCLLRESLNSTQKLLSRSGISF